MRMRFGIFVAWHVGLMAKKGEVDEPESDSESSWQGVFHAKDLAVPRGGIGHHGRGARCLP